MTKRNEPTSSPRCSESPVSLETYLLVIYSLVVIALALPSYGCAAAKTQIPSYGEAKKKVLAGGPLVQEPIEKRMKLEGGKAAGVKKGEPAPHSGVVLDFTKSEEYLAIKAERDRLREELRAARLAKGTTKIIMDATVQRLKEEVKRTWWERNRGVVGLVLGIVLGTSVTVGLVYGLSRGQGISTTTTAVTAKRRQLQPALVRW